MLLMMGINAIILAIHRFIPEKYLTIICVLLGAVGSVLLIPEASLIWSVPSPRTALVIVGIVFGALARGAHSKFKAGLKRLGLIYDDETSVTIVVKEKPPDGPAI